MKMLLAVLAALVVNVCPLFLSSVMASEFESNSHSFSDYIQQYEEPQIFFHNDHALEVRLRLLDQAPAGAIVKVLTFTFDNGESTKKLAAHLCKAARRGVNIHFMSDSKYGSNPDAKSIMFDNVVNEEIYQYMANCGVKVRIYNYISTKEAIERAVTVAGNLNSIKEEYEEYKKKKQTSFWARVAKAFNIFDHIHNYMTEKKKQLLLSLSTTGMAWNIATQDEKEAYENAAKTLRYLFQYASEVEYLKDLEFVKDLPNSPANRLNHRKLFWIENPTSKEACFMLGGRNLGDHYLAWHDHSWLDVDVLLCRHHLENQSDSIVKSAESSFDELWNDRSQILFDIKQNFNREYHQIRLERVAKIDGRELRRDEEELSFFSYAEDNPFLNAKSKEEMKKIIAHGTIPIVRPFNNREIALKGFKLSRSQNWQLKKAGWLGINDEIRETLIQSIDKELSEIYIETPYAQFDDVLKAKLESALKRNVKVKLITNGYFTSDGMSWMIRLLMGRWVREMQEKYPNTFSFSVTTLHSGHAIHFKGAGFKCQKDGKKLFLIGSHNFHPRSGLSDKEHAVVWNEPVQFECAARIGIARFSAIEMNNITSAYTIQSNGEMKLKPDARDLIDRRNEFYSGINKIYVRHKGMPLIKSYLSLHQELGDVFTNPKVMKNVDKLRFHFGMTLYYGGFNQYPNKQPELKPEIEGVLNQIRDVTKLIEYIM